MILTDTRYVVLSQTLNDKLQHDIKYYNEQFVEYKRRILEYKHIEHEITDPKPIFKIRHNDIEYIPVEFCRTTIMYNALKLMENGIYCEFRISELPIVRGSYNTKNFFVLVVEKNNKDRAYNIIQNFKITDIMTDNSAHLYKKNNSIFERKLIFSDKIKIVMENDNLKEEVKNYIKGNLTDVDFVENFCYKNDIKIIYEKERG